MDPVHIDPLAVGLVLISCLMLHVLHLLFTARAARLGPNIVGADARIREIDLHIGKLSAVADFVEVSKLQREKVKLEKQQNVAETEAKAARSSAVDYGGLLARYVRPIVYAALVSAMWSTPVARLPAASLGPLRSLLAIPGWPGGTVGIVPWLSICHTVTAQAVGWVGVASGLTPFVEDKNGIMGLIKRAMGVLPMGKAKFM